MYAAPAFSAKMRSAYREDVPTSGHTYGFNLLTEMSQQEIEEQAYQYSSCPKVTSNISVIQASKCHKRIGGGKILPSSIPISLSTSGSDGPKPTMIPRSSHIHSLTSLKTSLFSSPVIFIIATLQCMRTTR